MENFIVLDKSNIDCEHICCAISDKKCQEGYQKKKDWLTKEFANGYIFRRLDARAKVFMEYGPAEKGWAPVAADNYFLMNCFWVSGQYKGHSYGKQLLQLALDDAAKQGRNGIATVAGISKFAFMSDTKWLLKQGFEVCDKLPSGFVLLVKKINAAVESPKFNDFARAAKCESSEGLVVYYSNRCPYAEFHINEELKETAAKRNLPLVMVKIETMEQAQCAPTPATIFSLFLNGKFITTDISVCLDSRFDKIIAKASASK